MQCKSIVDLLDRCRDDKEKNLVLCAYELGLSESKFINVNNDMYVDYDHYDVSDDTYEYVVQYEA